MWTVAGDTDAAALNPRPTIAPEASADAIVENSFEKEDEISERMTRDGVAVPVDRAEAPVDHEEQKTKRIAPRDAAYADHRWNGQE